MWCVIFQVFIFIVSISNLEAARILAVFPTPSISHQIVFRPLVSELVKRGHQVLVITTDPAFRKDQAPNNLTEIDVHDISYKLWSEKIVESSTGKSNDLFKQIKVAFIQLGIIFGEQMKSEEVQKILKRGKFNLILLEGMSRPGLSLAYVLKTPVIQISSFGAINGNYESIGAPVLPLLYPTTFCQNIVNLTFLERVSEIINEIIFVKIHNSLVDTENKIVRRIFGENVPSVSELAKNPDMLFINMHPIWDGNRPVPPGVLFMGGLHQKPSKALSTELKSYLDGSKNGVIYVSFGTNIDPTQLPSEKIQILVKVLSKLPYNVLWKWNGDELPGKTANINISKWFPQSDLLMHPKIKLFITQGGLQSTDDAITAGVPLIGIPILGDQWYNVEQYRRNGIGLRLDMDTLTENKLKKSVETVINDKSYRHNIFHLRDLMQDRPESSLNLAIWWIEYVLKHGGVKHLRTLAADVSWSAYLELELVFSLFFIAISFLAVCFWTLCYIGKYFL